MRGYWMTACAIVSACLLGGTAAAQEVLFKSTRLTSPNKFDKHMEGPAVDKDGNLFVPNFGEDGTIGKLAVGAAEFELFTKLPPSPPGEKISIGNGIRFDREGRMYIADFQRHNIFVIEAGEKTPRVYFTTNQSNGPKFHQPKRPGDCGRWHAVRKRPASPGTDMAHHTRSGRQRPR
jgi:hypothetical protein